MSLLTEKQKAARTKRAQKLREETAAAAIERVDTNRLIDRLQAMALGTAKRKMTAAELKAAEMLLDKTIPNLAAVKHEHEAQNVSFFINTEFTPPAPETQ